MLRIFTKFIKKVKNFIRINKRWFLYRHSWMKALTKASYKHNQTILADLVILYHWQHSLNTFHHCESVVCYILKRQQNLKISPTILSKCQSHEGFFPNYLTFSSLLIFFLAKNFKEKEVEFLREWFGQKLPSNDDNNRAYN